jgi:plasmid stabilization system protein ParE
VKVIYTERATRDLAQIHGYVAKEANDIEVANRFISRLIDACDELSFSGTSFHPYRYSPARRMMPSKSTL